MNRLFTGFAKMPLKEDLDRFLADNAPLTYQLSHDLRPSKLPLPASRTLRPMNLTDIAARVERLTKLSAGLAKEIVSWRECHDPLLYRERQDYLAGIRQAQNGVEEARLALVKAKQRLAKMHGAGSQPKESGGGVSGAVA
jgi:hypothetical protein